jgi:hypothetical protein
LDFPGRGKAKTLEPPKTPNTPKNLNARTKKIRKAEGREESLKLLLPSCSSAFLPFFVVEFSCAIGWHESRLESLSYIHQFGTRKKGFPLWPSASSA